MVETDPNPPPGAPRNFPIRLTTPAGIQIVYGAPHSRQPPGSQRQLGIGISLRKPVLDRNTPTLPWDESQYPDWDQSWAGLYDQKLHELFWNFTIHTPADVYCTRPSTSAFPLQSYSQTPGTEMVLHLPMMGMPPREPTAEMMTALRRGDRHKHWFRHAYIFPATDILNAFVLIDSTTGPGRAEQLRQAARSGLANSNQPSVGDDVVIRLPACPASNTNYAQPTTTSGGAGDPSLALFHQTQAQAIQSNIRNPSFSLPSPTQHLTPHPAFTTADTQHGFDYRTHLPSADPTAPKSLPLTLSHLYFIQLLPNELPSYHFWARPDYDPPHGHPNRSTDKFRAGSTGLDATGTWWGEMRDRPDGSGSPFADVPGAACSRIQRLRGSGAGTGTSVATSLGSSFGGTTLGGGGGGGGGGAGMPGVAGVLGTGGGGVGVTGPRPRKVDKTGDGKGARSKGAGKRGKAKGWEKGGKDGKQTRPGNRKSESSTRVGRSAEK